ncbi:hypothetical protein Taro_054396 [Colocasia esculenta]|uniref:Uncharacterized protein n=1 Tax=Colocasia esculenta TaxID=4460 RepID=A0A843XR28_COLES|nr:hypothetical protein [Colocasia esculenta]
MGMDVVRERVQGDDEAAASDWVFGALEWCPKLTVSGQGGALRKTKNNHFGSKCLTRIESGFNFRIRVGFLDLGDPLTPLVIAKGFCCIHEHWPSEGYLAYNLTSPSTGDILGLGSQASNVFLVADIDGSSLIVCGKAFADADSVRDALSALAAPVLSAKGVPVSARPLAFGDSLVLLFASEDTIKSCSDLHGNLISADAGVVLCSYGVTPFFQTGDAGTKLIQKACICGFCICRQLLVLLNESELVSLIFHTAHFSSGVLPSVSKLTLGQAAYPFLLKDHEIPAFFINVNDGGKHIDGKDLVKSTLSKSILESTLGTSSDPKVGALKEKYKSFLSSKFPEIPEEFTFRMPK